MATALCVAGATDLDAQTSPPAAQTQAPVTKSQAITATATIKAIDTAMRTVTLRDTDGNEDTFSVGSGVQRFNELKVGDTVRMTYYESMVFMVRKPGDPAPTAATTEAAVARAQGALPAGVVGVQDKLTVTVKAIDPAVPSVTVTTSDGRTVTRKIQDRKNIEGLKVGDTIDITYTRALITNIER
jgi:Cu/Ag efflux protein CusF